MDEVIEGPFNSHSMPSMEEGQAQVLSLIRRGYTVVIIPRHADLWSLVATKPTKAPPDLDECLTLLEDYAMGYAPFSPCTEPPPDEGYGDRCMTHPDHEIRYDGQCVVGRSNTLLDRLVDTDEGDPT